MGVGLGVVGVCVEGGGGGGGGVSVDQLIILHYPAAIDFDTLKACDLVQDSAEVKLSKEVWWRFEV